MEIVNEATDYAEDAPYAAARACIEICVCEKEVMCNGSNFLY